MFQEEQIEFNFDMFHIFIDFGQEFDTILLDKLYDIFEELSVLLKLINLVSMCLENMRTKVKVQDTHSSGY